MNEILNVAGDVVEVEVTCFRGCVQVKELGFTFIFYIPMINIFPLSLSCYNRYYKFEDVMMLLVPNFI